MSEINNNGFSKINKIQYSSLDKIPQKTNGTSSAEKAAESSSKEAFIPDTVGRSQVKGIKGGDITKSVDEAVLLAAKHPEIVSSGDELFNLVYDRYIKEGLTPDKAYALAACGQEIFEETAKAQFNK